MNIAEAPAGHWPWWLGALWLGAVMLIYRLTTGRDLGVSGFIRRLVGLRGELTRGLIEQQLSADPEAMERALIAATLEEMRAAGVDPSELPGMPVDSLPPSERPARPLPWHAPSLFLLGLVGGGAAAELSAPGPLARGLDSAFAATWGSGWCGALALLAGGLLVGFGTRMAGGCTSGHGLAGCSRLDRASLLATACFFAGGIALTLLAGRS